MTILGSYLSTRQGIRIAATLTSIGIAALPGTAFGMDPIVRQDATGSRYIEEGVGLVDPDVQRYTALETEKAAMDVLVGEMSGRYFMCQIVRADADETMKVIREIAGSSAPSKTRLEAMRSIASDFLETGAEKAVDRLLGTFMDPSSAMEDGNVHDVSQETPGGFLNDVDRTPETTRWQDIFDTSPDLQETFDWKAGARKLIEEIDTSLNALDTVMTGTSECLFRARDLVASFESVSRVDPTLTADVSSVVPAEQDPLMFHAYRAP